jgi:DNA-binding response OmpR family regulator
MTRIMLLEDEEAFREILLDFFVDDGFEVIQANIDDTVSPLLDRADLQLLLIDIGMPGRLDGIALAKVARASQPLLPVVFITGSTDAARRARNLCDPSAVLEKPFHLDSLLATVQRLIGVRVVPA